MKLKLKRIIKKLAPSLITGGADNDPSGIATYSMSGAIFGYAQLWLMVLATPMLIAVQSMCARLGNIRRVGLSTIVRQEYGPTVAWVAAGILIITNVVTIGADILAVSAAFELVSGVSLKIWVLPVTLGVWYIMLFKNYKTLSRFLLWLLVFFFTYIIAAVLAQPDWGNVLQALVWPTFSGQSKEYYMAAVALLGTTITPYLFFWQVKEEVEEHKRVKDAEEESRHEDRIMAPGFIFSQIITVFIIIAAGATLFASGIRLETAADAARALEPVAGPWATWLFALGIVGAGLLALPILAASTAYVVAETARWKGESLSSKINRARGFYTVITLSLLSGVAMLLLDVPPIRALYYSQVLAGLLAPIMLVLILMLTNKRSIMGEFRNGWFDNLFGTMTVVVMVVAGVLMFI